mgnify:CR=1 FL=1
MRNLLYIGLNGFAGSGKDTVAKMIKTILNYDWDSIEECKAFYKSIYTSPTISATYNSVEDKENKPVYCVAFADQLKKICSDIFGIDEERFYQNKANAWVCINKEFQYTEIQPESESIVTAEQYYNDIPTYKSSDKKYWMSLREILVYVGTYVLQQDLNKNIFVNIVSNLIEKQKKVNPHLQYVILTDIRFNHEINYIHRHNGITISIVRDNVKQLDNIAEHDLDDEDRWDYTITNNGTYDELFSTVWDILHDDIEFSNECVELDTRENVDNYLRLVFETNESQTYKICTSFQIQQIMKDNGEMTMINLTGGPMIEVGKEIPGTGFVCNKIVFRDDTTKFYVDVS